VTARTVGGPLRFLAGLIVLYLAAPLVALVVRFATTPRRGFHDAGLYPALWVSLSGATISLAIITVVGLPLAFVLARSSSRLSKVVGVLVQIPLALPPLMSGIVLIYLVGPYTFLGRLFERGLTNSRTGVVLAMTFVAAPFLVVAARAAFESLDQSLLDVAETLGHGEVSRFVRVAVPVAAPGIRAGMVLAWLRAFGEYGAVVVLAYNPTSLPIYTYNQFSGAGLSTTLAPTALALGAAVVVVGLSRVRWRRRAPHLPAVDSRASEAVAARPIRFDVDHRLGSFHLHLTSSQPVRHLAVLGPSGAGKSVLLRSLAGLYGSASAQLWCGEEALGDVPVVQRGVGYVAQGFSLFPHLTVWQQLLFARRARPDVARYWLHRLGLDGLETARPAQLSGGQRQRVALGQVLCAGPALLLLDEPFSALDVPVRQDLRRLVRELQRETGLSTVLVTHDPEEAGFLSEDVVVLSGGAALQTGTSREVFAHPASPEVARLLGIANLLPARVVAEAIECDGVTIHANVATLERGDVVSWSVRPERVTLAAPGATSAGNRSSALSGTILDVAYVGVASDYLVAIGPSTNLLVRSSDLLEWSVGDACDLVIRADDVSLWPR
jgi:ABC-type Fe3+/spermidine/putrescine transport system ATPase subunit/ABC-type sulfate transport system permease component